MSVGEEGREPSGTAATAYEDGSATDWHLPALDGQTPWRQTITGTDGLAIAFADDEDGVTADDLERFWEAGLMVTPIYTIDGEIRYRRPAPFAGKSFPISSDLLP